MQLGPWAVYLTCTTNIFFFFAGLSPCSLLSPPTLSLHSRQLAAKKDIYIYIYTFIYIYICMFMYMYDIPTIPTHKFDCKSTTSITWRITLLRNGSVSVGLEFNDKSR